MQTMTCPEAESGVICSFLISPQEVGSYCFEQAVTARQFGDEKHAIIFRHIWAMYEAGETFDFIVLTQRLRTAGELEAVGGPASVTDLFILLPTAGNVVNYVSTLKAYHLRREVQKTCRKYSVQSEDELRDPEEMYASLQRDIAAIPVTANKPRLAFKQQVLNALEDIETGRCSEADILSGIEGLDKDLKIRRGNFIVLAGEAKSGKTALAHQILLNASLRQRQRCVCFSLEMNVTENIHRLIACEGRVNLAMVGTQPTHSQLDGINRASMLLAAADIELVDDCHELGQVIVVARQLHAKAPIDVLMLDYLQLVEGSSGKKTETRQEAVAQVSRTCKRLAAEMNCVVLALSQLNDDGKLRESRAIGQDANAVVSVEKLKDGGRSLCIIAQRNGSSDVTIAVEWRPQFTRFDG